MKLILISLLILSLWVLLTSLFYSQKLKLLVKKQVSQAMAFDKFEKLIVGSGLARFRCYNSLVHIVVSVLTSLTSYNIARMRLGVIASLTCALMGALIPTILLRVSTERREMETRQEALNFYAIFKNYAATGYEIFTAFKACIPELNEPYKQVITRMIMRYEMRVDPVTCLQLAGEELALPELKSFFQTLIVQYVEGGDIIKLTNEFLRDLGELMELDQQENAEDQKTNFGIYLLTALDASLLLIISNTSTNSVITEIGVTANLALALFLVLNTFVKPKTE